MGNINIIIEPCLHSFDGIITEANNEFTDLTGFKADELLGKSLIEIGVMIRINTQILLNNICDRYLGYIFTKSLSVREVNISLIYYKELNEKVYTFVEKPNSRLDDKLIFMEQTLSDNIVGVSIYSVPDLIMVKVNQKYLDFHDYPYNQMNTSIGLSIKEIVTGYVGTESEVLTNTVIKTRKSSYLKEIKFERFSRGITYWDSNRTPIFEDGEIKYVMFTTTDSTESVFRKENIERQNKKINQQKKQLELQKEQLEQKNLQLNSILENLSEAVILTDDKGKYIMQNREARKLLYKSEKLIDLGDTFNTTKYFDMEGNKILFENLPGIRALKGERVENTKMFVRQPEKEYFMNNSAIPIYNTNGDLTMVVSCFHDITDTIHQTKKIEEQKKELEAIIENISDGISVFNNKGQYILFNKSAREMFCSSYEYLDKIGDGNKQSELYDIDGKKIDSGNNPSLRVMRGEKFKNIRMSIKFPYKTIQIAVSGTPIYNSEGKLTLGVLCHRDMTDYFKHEEAIRGRYEFMDRIIDTFDLPVVRLSCPDLKVVNINQKALNIIKLLRADVKLIRQIKGNKLDDLVKTFKELETSKCYQYINEVVKQKKTKYLNKKSLFINGDQVYWNVIFEPILETNGEFKEILIIAIDVTDEVNSNIAMEKSLKVQDEIFANVAHELKTPLNVISSTVQLFDMYLNNGSFNENKNSIIKYIESVKRNCYRLSKLINNIVDLSKIEAGFFELSLSNNNIVEIVEDIVMSVTNFSESKGLNIIFDTDTEEKIIAFDQEKIERIVINLISNAIKFSDNGDEILVDIKDKDTFIEISVKDNGIGIEQNDLNMIFDRFRQVDKSLSRNAEGTGIGLSLVKSIAELHGGSINVESEFGKGSKFTVILPAKIVLYENTIYNNKMRNRNETVQVELSDIHQ